ncbi:MAG TPA: zinc dependent phospholipase C family protein [Nanoarchaeota archaeon]|nr:zinc dependent phospholipase C family protein [Nanoarchaeota archaeon]
MLPIFHASAALALQRYRPGFEIRASFVAGCIAPDLYVLAPKVFSFGETHDINNLNPATPNESVLLKLKDKKFALGFATHAIVLDPISHGFSTAQGYATLRAGQTAGLQDSHSFGWIAKRFPGLLQHPKAYEWSHVVAESFLETWISKYHPEVLEISNMLYNADIDAIVADLAQAFGKPRDKVGKAVAIGMQYAKQISRFHALLAPFALDDSDGSRKKCLEQCLEACRKFSKGELARQLME